MTREQRMEDLLREAAVVLECVIQDCNIGPHIQHQATLRDIRALLDEPEGVVRISDGRIQAWKDGQRGDPPWNRREVEGEMARQDLKWGEQNHEDEVWLAVLTEEVGEVAKAILERRAEFDTRPFSVEMRTEVVQCAAVCLQWLSALDRRAPIGPWEAVSDE